MRGITQILSIIGIISTIGLILYYVPIMNERAEIAQERLDVERQKLNEIINKDIVYCIESLDSRCNQVMMGYFEECKKEELTKIPSCHDGRIFSYLETKNLIETNDNLTKSTVANTNQLNKISLQLFDSCLDALDRLNDGLAEYGPESKEFSSLLDDFKSVREECNKSAEDIKNYCKREKDTSNYFEACDDPRLNKFPI